MNSPLVLVVRGEDPTPPFEQLRRQLADLIRSGVLSPGHRLPPVRQLAGDLGLAVGTVARAYRELEAAGLVCSRRGAGTRVVEAPGRLSGDEQRRLLHGRATAYVREVLLLGVGRTAAVEAVREVLDQLDLPPSGESEP